MPPSIPQQAAAPPQAMEPSSAGPSPRAPERAAPLEGQALRVELGDFRLQDVSFSLERGRITALVGPNGSGKTTVLRMLARLLAPEGGLVCVEGRPISALSTREVARLLAVLPQAPQIPAGVTVRELVGFGRHPHQRLLRGQSRADRDAVDWAIHATDLGPLADRAVESLSGGERQRAWVGMALAQRTDVLLLDEPTTYLDIRHQVETLALVRRLNRELGLTVAWVLHDLNQAAAHSDRIIAMQRGRIVAHGPPDDVLTPHTIHSVFGIEATVTPHPEDGSPLIIPSTTPCRCQRCIAPDHAENARHAR